MNPTTEGQRLWEKAKKLIPGGTQLLSKRPERFLPGLWPTYYSKAKGCEVWDYDGNHFYDFAQMGVGSCVLGYADDSVNEAVIRAIQDGSMSSLNCLEEIELAEELTSLHPGKNMVRFTRTGGEACAVAIRIARSASGKDAVAVCGYHGWHDWYLSANLSDEKSLDGQLLPGLKPSGVPRALKGTNLTFEYNKLDQLEAIVEKHGKNLGVIYMEPRRSYEPSPGFLQGVRDIANKIGAVLVFDEVTSGFRVNVGGIHSTMGVDPDIAIYGKALGNGFPIAAVVGKESVMDAAQDSFISSTFWTERVGFAAALATLKKMRKENVPDRLVHYGKKINQAWSLAAKEYGISISISGIEPLTSLSFQEEKPLVLQTLYNQLMMEKGYLMSGSPYTTYAYSDALMEKFTKDTMDAFKVVARAKESKSPEKLLKGEPLSPAFKRLS